MARLAGILIVAAAATTLIAAPLAPPQRDTSRQAFSVVEAGISDLRQAMESGRTTSRAVTEQYLARISRYNDRLRAAITVNPNALAEADVRDRERKQRRVRGLLHGIPIALKDNIHTLEMPTTGGALAFAGLKPPYEATLTRRLRDAGAIIIAKTTLTELANWVSSSMPPGYNSLLGFSINPYATPARENVPSPLTPGGSSSGIGTAASLWAANVGTETSGSILNPANQNLLVGIKPTVGRISRYGVIPITADQDTPGPLARTVTDAAILLGALEGSAPDPNDPATRACIPPPRGDYTRFLRREGLKSARIGIVRAPFSKSALPRVGRLGALDDVQQRAIDDAVDVLRRAGATVIDPADLPSLVGSQPAESLANWPICIGLDDVTRSPATCSIVLRYGMKRDFNRWLASLGSAAPLKTLTELRSWNLAHQGEGTLRFGQDQLDASDAIDLDAHRARYESDRARDLALTRTMGIDATLRANRLDALIFPGYLGASIAARAGYPTVIVPFLTAAPLLAEPTVQRSPLGISFTGTSCAEPRLLEIAYAFEQATARRVPPALD